jgi:hypothetical protein
VFVLAPVEMNQFCPNMSFSVKFSINQDCWGPQKSQLSVATEAAKLFEMFGTD